MGNSKRTRSKIDQAVVNQGQALLLIDSCIQYGLLELVDKDGKKVQGSGINVDRIVSYLDRAKKKGVEPQKDVVESVDFQLTVLASILQ